MSKKEKNMGVNGNPTGGDRNQQHSTQAKHAREGGRGLDGGMMDGRWFSANMDEVSNQDWKALTLIVLRGGMACLE